MFEFHVSRTAREKYDFDQSMFGFDGSVIFTDYLAARKFTQKINKKRDLVNFPETSVSAGEINAAGLIDEILHLVISLYRKSVDPLIFSKAFVDLEKSFDDEYINKTLIRFTQEFPPISVYLGEISAESYLASTTNGTPNRHIVLEELIILWVTNKNPAVSSFSDLFDDKNLTQMTIYHQMIENLQHFFKQNPTFGPDNQDLISMLRSPAIEEPHSLLGQLEFIRRRWGLLVGEYLYRLLNSMDLIHEETKPLMIGPGDTFVPQYFGMKDEENFSPDSDWMPRTVMMAKNSYVWLYQLSETYQREIKHLDQIPDEELDKLASWGFNGLWLIGLWERSAASKRIKQLCGNPDAVASAYSLKNYSIASDLGGEEAYQRLREKAWRRGIRLASDMVPNHMGIDSDWVVDHPDWFISLENCPFPAYSFNGPDFSPVDHVSLFIEDHYYDRTDASVVFKYVNKVSGATQYIYHGNDGTSMPWNDTAQLNYLKAEVREAVIQTILHVARKFPIIRFDAAMTLAKKHYQRLWFPQPGSGGAIPSRSEFGLTKDTFDQMFPNEFWREVVDRVAAEVPETLLLAEAFWMMEGYFVRTLGMHRVYNSAFMNMLRNEENAKYRLLIKNTLEFDPQILKRYVNFMNNPDEKTAVEQFGKGDKYFGICTLMATMPGLPMFGHGQISGFSEKYGMEYYRPYWDEKPDNYLIQRHQKEIFPLLNQRELFADVQNFLLYDFMTEQGNVNENVYAYSNGNQSQRSLVIFHNNFGSTSGWIHSSTSYLNKESGIIESKQVWQGLGLSGGRNQFVIFRDTASGLEYLRSSQEITQKGLLFHLDAYECHVFSDFREIQDNEQNQFKLLNNYLAGRGVPNIDEAIKELMLSPILTPLRDLVNPEQLKIAFESRLRTSKAKINPENFLIHTEKFARYIEAIKGFVNMDTDITSVKRTEQRGLEAILRLQVFEEHYPFPGSKKYRSTMAYIQKNLDTYPFIWYILILWNDLRLIGRVITSDPHYAEISQSWLQEWGISRVVHDTLEKLGMDSQQAQSGVNILRILVGQQNWAENITEETGKSLLESWFSDNEVRAFLSVNRYQGKLWFNKEAFESLMWWMMTSLLVELIADPQKSITEGMETLFIAYELITDILDSEDGSNYQVDKLLESL